MDTSNDGYLHVATLCHASSNTCPQVFVNADAPEDRRVKIVDDFGGEVFLSAEQLQILRAVKL